MQLQLSSEEKEIVSDILRDYLADLKLETADTEGGDFLSLLDRREAAVRKLLQILSEGATGGEQIGI